MNSFGLTSQERAAWRTPTASEGMGPEIDLIPTPQGTQASLWRRGNEIKSIARVGKYFLTISNQQFGANEYREPGEWLR